MSSPSFEDIPSVPSATLTPFASIRGAADAGEGRQRGARDGRDVLERRTRHVRVAEARGAAAQALGDRLRRVARCAGGVAARDDRRRPGGGGRGRGGGVYAGA